MQSVSPIGVQPPKPADRATSDAAREFEGVMLGQLVKSMMDTVGDAEFGGGAGESAFKGFLSEQIGASMAAGGGIGLAAPVQAELLRRQEMQK